MSFPTAGDYQEALQVPEAAFADEELQEGMPEADVLGLPRAVAGAYAVVFPIHTGTGKVAVKCFLVDDPDRHGRYEAVSQHLEEVELDAAGAFDYQPEGVLVEGRRYPLLKMPWIDGQPLNRFVEAHCDEPEVMRALGEAWLDLVVRMEAAEMAHGDLQHGNVLVTGDPSTPKLRLVDFDTAFVPARVGRTSPEVGHRNYQHPDRDEHDYGLYVDRFAALVLYTAIRAVRAEPDLWPRYDTGENLLFRAADFHDPDGSALFDDLQRLEPVRPLAEQLRRACLLEPADVPPLADVLGGETLPATAHVPRRRTKVRAASAGGARTRRAMSVVGAVILVSAAGAAIVVGGFLGALVVLAALAGGLGAWWRRYQRLPAVRRRRRLRSEVAYFDALVDRLDDEVGRLEHERRVAVEGAEARREQRLEELREEALYDHLKYHFVQEVVAIEGVSHKVVVRLKAAALRTAYDVTPEGLKHVREVGKTSRERLLAWRQSLVERYVDELPERLSPAQERRLENVLRHRLRDLDSERQRAREKRRVQQEERADVLARLKRVPTLSFVHYVAWLCGLATLPDDARPRPARSHHRSIPVRTDARRASESDQGGVEGTPPGHADDDAWWRQAS